MGRVVIACYRPKPGKEEALLALTRDHVPKLRKLGLVTRREPVIMQAEDGTVVEVFEWASAEAIEKAHSHPQVHTIWEAYAEVAEHVPVGELEEAAELFSEFAAV